MSRGKEVAKYLLIHAQDSPVERIKPKLLSVVLNWTVPCYQITGIHAQMGQIKYAK